MNLSWSAFHEKGTSELNPAISSLLPLFEEQAASPAMSRHSMDVQYLNPGQTPVMACDQPLFDITKQIQWISHNSYGQDLYVTAAALYTLLQKAYSSYVVKHNDLAGNSDEWRQLKEDENPQIKFWSLTLEIQLSVLVFVRSLT